MGENRPRASGLIADIFREQIVHDESGTAYPLHSSIDASEGEFLAGLIESDASIRRTIEVGCAYGVSSLYICSALTGRASAHHTIIDPNQQRDWHGIGRANLRRAGFDFITLIERPSEFALAELAERESGGYDLVFIDGFHTFDQTMVDLYFANRLVRVGGYIVIDDCNYPPVAKAVTFTSRFPAYRLINAPWKSGTVKRRVANLARMIVPAAVARYTMPVALHDRWYLRSVYSGTTALQKVAPDERAWTWHELF